MSLKHWFVLAGLAAGCGTVTDPMMGDDQPPPDTTGPKLMSATPSDAATKVSVIAPLTFTFDEALDPTKAIAGVKVTYLGPYSNVVGLPGTASYDAASHTITFMPKIALEYGSRYTVHLANTITDEAGNAFSGVDLKFTASVNTQTKYVYYGSGTTTPTSWQTTLLDSNGYPQKYLYFNNPGPDGNWFTADDVVSSRSDYLYNADGQNTQYRSFSAGPDTKYNTADDVITYLSNIEYDSQGRYLEETDVSGPGIDGMWGNADDAIEGYEAYTYSTGLVIYAYYSDPGADGMWKTADDVTDGFGSYMLDAQGNVTAALNYSSGPDQLPNTSDDVLNGYSEYMWSPLGLESGYRYHNAPGPDGQWMTADDSISSVTSVQFDANGFRTSQSYFSNPGPDTVWGTADDVVSSYYSMASDAHGVLINQTGYTGPGADGIWGTADDPLSYYYTYTIDGNGLRTDSKYFNTPGPDGTWKNNDDHVLYDYDYDVAH